MSDYQHCPEGLALYLGAECECDNYIDHPWENERITERGKEVIEGDTICALKEKIVGNLCIFLRPLSSMTEEERQENSVYEYAHWRLEELHDMGIFTDSEAQLLRSKGFDIGGWCMKDGERVWVDSYISVGLAKEVKQ